MDLMLPAADLSPPYSEDPAALVGEKLEDPQPKPLDHPSGLTRVPRGATTPHQHTMGGLLPDLQPVQDHTPRPCTWLGCTPPLTR